MTSRTRGNFEIKKRSYISRKICDLWGVKILFFRSDSSAV